MEICGELHPSQNVSCKSPKRSHSYHFAVCDGINVEWPNALFEVKRPIISRASRIQKLAAMATKIREIDEDAVSLHMNSHDTEVAAAESEYPRSGTQRMKVLEVIKASGSLGITDEEIQIALVEEMGPNTARPRRVELESGGWIMDSGNRRLTQRGQQAIVWVVS